ncbi:MAG: tRNA pseudouridine(38-40) synthase TruA [Deltaproteobacteria bacterium]|nr:tRNA pseudouridine(38-40) synthase TruA [Deltaproteobacteria bacterium]
MPRLKLTLAYVGTAYSGWQIQEKPSPPPTVQGELERALARVCGRTVRVFGAGRTDAGVHADAQVAHCDVPALRAVNWQAALNVKLPPDIRILSAQEAADTFHARRDARKKTYRYDLWLSRQVAPPRLAPFVWACGPLNLSALEAALPLLTATHDFRSFQNRGTEMRDAVRTVLSLRPAHPAEFGGAVLSLYMEADGFLKQMARNITGLLVAVGRGGFDPSRIPALLAARERAQSPPTAPALGLTLVRVDYDDGSAAEKS